jgi:Fanconi anemia group M protein
MQLLDQTSLETRTYQEIISAEAAKQNTMVVLPTGLGKTVIAARTAAKKLEDGKAVFLAPTKPLAKQHERAFNEFLNLDSSQMSLLTGEVSPDKRESMYSESRMFFATPQVVENDLIRGRLSPGQISFVVFDEAHRATGNYSYNFISEKLPAQVDRLALTASPGSDKDKILEVADNLGIENFEVRTEDDPDVKEYVEDTKVQWEKVSLTGKIREASKKLNAARRQQLSTLKDHGHINSVNSVYKGQLLKLQGKISSKLSNSDDPQLYESISVVATAIKITQAVELLETQGINQAHSYIESLEDDTSKAAARALQNSEFSEAKRLIEYMKKKGKRHPKTQKLLKELESLGDSQKAIVFTESRDSVTYIRDILNENDIHAQKFVGQSGDTGMSQKEQAQKISEFDDDEFDVLVSTSIGEEGLDIPSVDKVVFYEPVASEIRDIQRAGRTGRQEEGQVLVLMAEDTKDEGNYWSAQNKKKKMKKAMKELKGEVQNTTSSKSLEDFEKEQKDSQRTDTSPETTVISDDRENAINRKLSMQDVELDTKRLEVADFVLSEQMAVERKTAEDLADSIVDNRLFDQVKDLVQYKKPVIIVEGTNIYQHRNIPNNAIRGTLTSLISDYNTTILFSNGKDDTARFLVKMAKREQRDEEDSSSVEVRKSNRSKNLREKQEFVVAGLPGVNTKLAQRLLNRFKSPGSVFSASADELAEVDGIGEKKAKSIHKVLSGTA